MIHSMLKRSAVRLGCKATMSSRLVPILACPEAAAIAFEPSPAGDHPLEAPQITHISSTTQEHLRVAASHLHASRLVAFPTETVYGLGANTLDPVATAKVYALKGRPSDNPLIVHVSSLRMLRSLIPENEQQISDLYLALIDAFWPGPLTLLFPARNPLRPPPAPQTIGIRLPSHPLARALITEADLPISAPSANSSGRPSPTSAAHVFADLGRKGAEPVLGNQGEVLDETGMLGCILDAGPCDVGVESTVVDGTQWSIRPTGSRLLKVLRPGGIGVEQIERVVAALDERLGFHGRNRTRVWVYGRDPPIQATATTSPATVIHSPRPQSTSSSVTTQPEIHNPSTPGMKYKHYSPSIPVYLLYPTNTFPTNPLETSADENPVNPDKVWKHIADQLVAARADSVTVKGQSIGGQTAGTLRFGLMAFDDSPLARALATNTNSAKRMKYKRGDESVEIETEIKSLGRTEEDAARALFRDMLAFEGSLAVAPEVEGDGSEAVSSLMSGEERHQTEPFKASSPGVDAILIEACSDTGVGLAVMERVNKAVGGGGTGDGLGIRGTIGQQKRFWVDMGT